MKPKIILTDADGVLVNWIEGFRAYMSAKGFREIPGTEDKYMLSKRYPVTHEEAQEYVKEFNESDLIANLNPMHGSDVYVKKLHEKHGFRFIVVTSISDHPDAYKNRKANLLNIFGDVFDEINCLEIGVSKTTELERWVNSDLFWIEDHFKQAEAGHEVGLKTVLISDPTNEQFHTPLFPRVESWEEIYHMICEDYGLEP